MRFSASVLIIGFFWGGFALSADLDDDGFGLLPTGDPACYFTASITRVREGERERESLHDSLESATSEKDFKRALFLGCKKCEETLRKEGRRIRSERGVVFFETKCYFARCSFGKGKAPVAISETTFREALEADPSAAFTCVYKKLN